MLSDAEKVDVRRFAGYGNYGNQGYMLPAAYVTLERKLNSLLTEEESVLRTVYLARLVTLEVDAVDQTAQNLDTDEAAVWVHNKNELYERRTLYFEFRCQMCDFLGVPIGPALQRSLGGASGSGSGNGSSGSNGSGASSAGKLTSVSVVV